MSGAKFTKDRHKRPKDVIWKQETYEYILYTFSAIKSKDSGMSGKARFNFYFWGNSLRNERKMKEGERLRR